MNAPIVLFVYNRLRHTEATINHLKKNMGAEKSKLIIYSDGPADESVMETVQGVREYIKTVSGFETVTVRCRETNYGLAANVLDGVTAVVEQYGKVIVLEDDIVTSQYFLEYMNEALNRYEKSDKVYSVTGYMRTSRSVKGMPESYFLSSSCSWGWGTWERAWVHFDEKALGWEVLRTDMEKQRCFNCDGTMNAYDMLEKQMMFHTYNSWAVRWHWTLYKAGAFTLYPNKKMCENIGNDCTGVHTGFDGRNHALDVRAQINEFPVLIEEQEEYRKMVYDIIRRDCKRERVKRIMSYMIHPMAVVRKVKRKIVLRW